MKVLAVVILLIGVAHANPVKRQRQGFFDGANVSLRKPVRASSAVKGVDPKALVDGKPTSTFTPGDNRCSMTLKQENPYMVIDMLDSFEIFGIDLWTRTKTSPAISQQDSNLEIRIGHNEDHTQNALCKYIDGPADLHARIFCDQKLCGRYVSIQRVRPGFVDNMNICELRAFTPDKTIMCPAPAGPTREDCLLPKETGTCGNNVARFYFNAAKCQCQQFSYGGCDGNMNNFETEAECQALCGQRSTPAKCLDAPDAGPCTTMATRYYFSAAQNACKKFQYGGCEGNSNNFGSKEDCKNACKAFSC